MKEGAAKFEKHMTEATQAYPEHDCYAWNVQHYHIRKEYLASSCGVCGAMTGFMWRSLLRRLLSCFTAEPHRKHLSE